MINPKDQGLLISQQLLRRIRSHKIAIRRINKRVNKEMLGLIVLLVGIAMVIGSLFIISPAHAQDIKDQDAIHAIIGEAGNQGYKGMLGVACALRNRGSLNGVNGIRNKQVVDKLYSHHTYAMAKQAWHESEIRDITRGANHWENVTKFGLPYWAKDMRLMITIKDHQFFKS